MAISGNTLVVTFNTALTGSSNKIRVAANSFKDAAGNVLSSIVTTESIAVEYDDLLTRADLAQILVEKFNLTQSLPPESLFIDVPLDHWAAGYIYAGLNKGLLNGYPDGTFHPEGHVTRAEYAYILYEDFKIPTYNPMSPSFSDVDIDYWAFTAIESIKHAGVMNGTLEGTFLPDVVINKADAIKVIQRIVTIPTLKLGDVNGDENINILDLQFINSNLGPVRTINAQKSDVYNDGQVDILDLLMVAQNIGN
ncbi:MAG: Cellulosome-anchoring protein precursor [Pelotomaculum sp. PtaB.Bin104]|nr:MAG: Cellulosome-anchoring protein precursor [Pelotomaculum sp. PtaB.Bin104]